MTFQLFLIYCVLCTEIGECYC